MERFERQAGESARGWLSRLKAEPVGLLPFRDRRALVGRIREAQRAVAREERRPAYCAPAP